ncbi:MAG TPA: YdcF family protein, partial [Bryobacteraceae bacterium]
VLGGDGYGLRILKAGQLERDGYVPAVLVSGPTMNYEVPECELAIPFAVRNGYPESYFRHIHGTYMNTADEADAIIAELRKENVKSILVVTSGYHTRRASKYYKHIPGIEARMIASPDRYANHGTWWRSREGKKTVLLEWSKTIATWFGI